jgi:hypothetical protein
MSTREKLIKARMAMLALAEKLPNVSKACQRTGISRSHFYEIKEAYENYGRVISAPQARCRRITAPEQSAQPLLLTPKHAVIHCSNRQRTTTQ